MLIKTLIVVMLLLIVGSLFSALFFLNKDKGGERTAKALTIRISLSIALFILLLIGFKLGLIGQH